MAGHSKFANIKHRKGRQDEARGKLFSKLAKEVMSAAREAGGDPSMNLRLRYAIDRAKENSMPRDNIERAIKKGTGELGGGSLEELMYEAYAPGGVAILIEALTDNRNRTAGEVKSIIEKRGGTWAQSGSVSFMFKRLGVFLLSKEKVPAEEELLDVVLEAGGEDLLDDGEYWEVHSDPTAFHQCLKAFESKSIALEDSSISWIPDNSIPVQAKEDAEKILRIIDALEDCDDVTKVSSNFDIPEEMLAEIHGS